MNEVLENTTEFHPAHVAVEAKPEDETKVLVQTDEETGAKDEVVIPTIH